MRRARIVPVLRAAWVTVFLVHITILVFAATFGGYGWNEPLPDWINVVGFVWLFSGVVGAVVAALWWLWRKVL
jgi:hypothetical protein